MMISFEIKWTNRQKFLGVISGILTITDQNLYIRDNVDDKSYCIYHRILGKCEVNVSHGSLGFKSIEGEKGIPSILLELMGDEIKDAMRNYYAGFLMNDSIYCHIKTKTKEKTTAWAKRKIREMEPFTRRALFKNKTYKDIDKLFESIFDEEREKDATGSIG